MLFYFWHLSNFLLQSNDLNSNVKIKLKLFFLLILSDSTQSVDSVWPLTLDQDLIDTLKVSFPNWFSSSTTAITEGGGKSGLNAATDKNSTLNLKTTLDGMEEGINSLFFI